MDKIPLPNKFELHEEGLNRAKLVIEPLFAGYGITIGNALRRVLLSSMPGSAITAVKIDGVDHEFSTMDNVKEDVVDILLNLKQVRVKCHTDEEVRLTISVKGKKTITGADIQANSDVEVVSPDAHIATLTADKAVFEAEFIVKRGRGYEPTEARKEEKKEIGMMSIDSIFTPIKNVSMDVQNVRVGQVTNFEQVTLDIETDGSITPKDAVALSSQIVVDHFSLLLESDLEPQTVRTELDEDVEEVDEEFTGESEVEAPAPETKEAVSADRQETTEA